VARKPRAGGVVCAARAACRRGAQAWRCSCEEGGGEFAAKEYDLADAHTCLREAALLVRLPYFHLVAIEHIFLTFAPARQCTDTKPSWPAWHRADASHRCFTSHVRPPKTPGSPIPHPYPPSPEPVQRTDQTV
jgi:hypothetical protein